MDFRIVMFHCPIISSAFFGRNAVLREKVLPIFEKYDVTAIISGHEHHFERGNLNGIMYMILGSGGGVMDVGLRPIPEAEVVTISPSYTEVEATEDSLTFSTYSLDNALIDKYKIEV